MLGDAFFDQGAHFAHRLFVLGLEGVELGRAGFAIGEQIFELTHERHHTGNLLGQHRLAAVEQRILRGAAHRGGGQVYAHRAIEHGHDRFVEIAAIGDAANDIEMLEYAGLAIAMGNASEEVKTIADIVTDTNENNGVIKAVDKLIQ